VSIHLTNSDEGIAPGGGKTICPLLMAVRVTVAGNMLSKFGEVRFPKYADRLQSVRAMKA